MLGSIPLLGNLFKTRQAQATKNNLMIFIRPKILRDANAGRVPDRFQVQLHARSAEAATTKGESTCRFCRKHEKPMMPPAPPIPPPSTAGMLRARLTEKAKAAKEQEEFDAEAVRRLEQRQKAGAPPVAPLPQPPAGSQTPPRVRRRILTASRLTQRNRRAC